jgi:hypothetical protein
MVAGDKGKVTELLVVDRIHMNRRCFQPSQASRCMCSKVNRSLLNNKRSSLSIRINPSRGCKHLRGSLCGWIVISQRHVPSLYRYFCSASVIDFVQLFRNSIGPSSILVCQRQRYHLAEFSRYRASHDRLLSFRVPNLGICLQPTVLGL